MSLDQLQSFVAVADTGKLTRAAQLLHISLPPLSRKIRALEEELGHPLFVRQPRGMRLTPHGARLLPHAREVLLAVNRAVASVSSPSDTASSG